METQNTVPSDSTNRNNINPAEVMTVIEKFKLENMQLSFQNSFQKAVIATAVSLFCGLCLMTVGGYYLYNKVVTQLARQNHVIAEVKAENRQLMAENHQLTSAQRQIDVRLAETSDRVDAFFDAVTGALGPMAGLSVSLRDIKTSVAKLCKQQIKLTNQMNEIAGIAPKSSVKPVAHNSDTKTAKAAKPDAQPETVQPDPSPFSNTVHERTEQ